MYWIQKASLQGDVWVQTWKQWEQAYGCLETEHSRQRGVDGKGLGTTVYCVSKFMEIIQNKDRTLGTSGPKMDREAQTLNGDRKEAEKGMINMIHTKYCDS